MEKRPIRRRRSAIEKVPVPRESQEQTWLMQWAWQASVKWPELDLLYHIPNGGSRNRVEAARLKAQGVKPGVPDLCLPVPRGRYHGLYIELKRKQHGTLSADQKIWIECLRRLGYRVEVCRGFQAAADLIEEYLQEGGDANENHA